MKRVAPIEQRDDNACINQNVISARTALRMYLRDG